MGTVTAPGFRNGRFRQGGQFAADPKFDAMSKDALAALAEERGVDLKDAATKAEIIAALKAAG